MGKVWAYNHMESKLEHPYGSWIRPDSWLSYIINVKHSHDKDESEVRLLGDAIDKILITLTPREEQYVREFFGIECEKSYSLKDIGNKHGITGTRVQQIIAKALRKLRLPCRSKYLKQFIIDRP